MRRWYFRGLAISGIGLTAFIGSVVGQDRPVAESIRVKPVEEFPRSLPPDIVIHADDPKIDNTPAPLALPPVGNLQPASTDAPSPPPPLDRSRLTMPADMPALPDAPSPTLPNAPLTLPTLDAPSPMAAQPSSAAPPPLPPLNTPNAAPPSNPPLTLPSLDLPKPNPPAASTTSPAGPLPTLDLPSMNPPAVSTMSPAPAPLPALPPLPDVPPLDPPSSKPNRKENKSLPILPVAGSDVTPLPKHTTWIDAQGVEHVGVDFENNGNAMPMLQAPPPSGAAPAPSGPYGSGPSPTSPSIQKPFWDKTYDPTRDGNPNYAPSIAIETVHRPRWWFEAEYLQWYMPQSRSPVMLYGGLADNSSTPANPVLGRTFPLNPIDGGGVRTTPGLRFTVGTWFEPSYHWGLEVSTLTVFERGTDNSYGSAGDLYLLRPFYDANTLASLFSQVAGPGLGAGGARITTGQRLDGEEVHFLYAWKDFDFGSSNASVQFLFGYRHLQFNDYLNMFTSTDVDSQNLVGTSTDRFSTSNDFQAAQVGIKTHYQADKWSLDMNAKIALGCVTQTTNISGYSATFSNGAAPVVLPGGFLALPSNIGEYQRQKLAFAPEVGLNLSYQFTSHIIGSIGYNFLYMSAVARSANAIDPVINTAQLPFSSGGTSPIARPSYTWRDDSLWAQGINLGLTFQY